MPRFFLNNFSTTLSAGITNVQTTLPLQAGDGALIPQVNQPFPFAPFGEDILLTIDDGGGNVEVVRVVDHDGSDTIDVVQRGFDGTVAQAFTSGTTVEQRNTESSMEQVWNNFAPRDSGITAPGLETVEIIPLFESNSFGALGFASIVIGTECGMDTVNHGNSVIIGTRLHLISTAGLGASIAIGSFNDDMDSDETVIIGHNLDLNSSGTLLNKCAIVGNNNTIRSDESVIVGYNNTSNGIRTIRIGSNNGTFVTLDETKNSTVIGHGWNQGDFNDFAVGHGSLAIGFVDDGLDEAIPGCARIIWPRCGGGRWEMEDGVTQKPSTSSNGYEAVFFTKFFDGHVANPFPQTRRFFTWQFPQEVFIYPNEIGLIFDLVQGAPTSVSVDMVIDVGTSGIDSTEILNAQTVTTGAVPNDRQRFTFTPVTAVVNQGVNSITFTLDTPITFDSGGFGCFAYVKGELYKTP